MATRNGRLRLSNSSRLLLITLLGVTGYWIGNLSDQKTVRFGHLPSRLLSEQHSSTLQAVASVDTTVGEDFEDSSEQEDSRAEDFLNVTVVVAIVLLLLLLTILFEHGKEHLEEVCEKDGPHMTSILEKLFGEMTVLGFLSIVTFLVTQTGTFRAISESLYGDQEELLEIFELVHFTIFFVMILFVVQVFVLVKGAIRTEHAWIHMDRSIRERRRSLAPNIDGGAHEPRLRSTTSDVSSEEAVFEALRDEFILERQVDHPFQPAPKSHRVTDDFPFGRYLGICLGNLLTRAVEVSSATWIFFGVATIAYYGVCLLVEENVTAITWIWVGVAWCLLVFNSLFESHLVRVRNAFSARVLSTRDTESAQLLDTGGSLPSWCQVDLDAHLRSRLPIARCIANGIPNRQQTLFWMGEKGPKLYLIILQVNLVFVGLYTAIHLLEFLPIMYKKNGIYMFSLYIVLASLPVLGIMLNKQQLVATMSQVCCMGVYRRPQVVTTVLREEKTAHVVRAFIILYKLRRMAEQSEHSHSRPSHQRTGRTFGHLETEEISRAFDAYDHSGDGVVTYEELKLLLDRLGASMDEASIQRVIKLLDVDNDGSISKAEFLQWYAEVEGHEDEFSEHERAEFLFGMFDDNGTGSVTIGEFKRKLDALHAGLGIDEVGAIVNELDRNNTGSVGPEEFEELIVKYYPRELR